MVKLNLHRKKISGQHIFKNLKFILGVSAAENEYTQPSLTTVIYVVNSNNHHQGSTEDKSRDFFPRKAFQEKGKGAGLGTSTKGKADQDTVL